jgi:hypothetical protein
MYLLILYIVIHFCVEDPQECSTAGISLQLHQSCRCGPSNNTTGYRSRHFVGVGMWLGVLSYRMLRLGPNPHHLHTDAREGILASIVVTSCLRSGPRRRRGLTHPMTDLFIYLACACSTLTLWLSLHVDDELCCVWTRRRTCFILCCDVGFWTFVIDNLCRKIVNVWTWQVVNLWSYEYVNLWTSYVMQLQVLNCWFWQRPVRPRVLWTL